MTAFAVTGYTLTYRETVYRRVRDELNQNRHVWIAVLVAALIGLAVLMMPNSIENSTIQAPEPTPVETEAIPTSPFDFLV